MIAGKLEQSLKLCTLLLLTFFIHTRPIHYIFYTLLRSLVFCQKCSPKSLYTNQVHYIFHTSLGPVYQSFVVTLNCSAPRLSWLRILLKVLWFPIASSIDAAREI